jgi:hypothetical protein
MDTKKNYNLKIVLLLISVIFLFSNTLYSYPFLRIPIEKETYVDILKTMRNSFSPSRAREAILQMPPQDLVSAFGEDYWNRDVSVPSKKNGTDSFRKDAGVFKTERTRNRDS